MALVQAVGRFLRQRLTRWRLGRLLARRVVVKNLYWRDAEIPLDGYDFRNCRFERCRLIHVGHGFRLVGCALVESRIEFK